MAFVKATSGDTDVDSGTENSMTLADVFQGTLGPYTDCDLIHVELASGTVYDLSQISGDEITLGIFDSQGHSLVNGECFVPGAKLLFAARVGGTHCISISAGGNVSNKYELLLTENLIPTGIYDQLADDITDGWWQVYFDNQGYLMLSPG